MLYKNVRTNENNVNIYHIYQGYGYMHYTAWLLYQLVLITFKCIASRKQRQQ